MSKSSLRTQPVRISFPIKEDYGELSYKSLFLEKARAIFFQNLF